MGFQVLTTDCSFLAIKFDAEKEERYQQELKQRELQRIEEALQTAARRGEPTHLKHLRSLPAELPVSSLTCY